MKWIDVVKKHFKMNPGKSLNDLLPAIRKEYYGLNPGLKKNKKTAHKKTAHKKGKRKNRTRRGRK